MVEFDIDPKCKSSKIVLILGANGFIGQEIVSEFSKIESITVIAHSRKKANLVNNVNFKYSSNAFLNLIIKSNLIINCTGLGLSKLYYSKQTNEQLTIEICKAIERAGKKDLDIIHLSSFKAYNPHGFSDIYARDKLNSEHIYKQFNLSSRTCIIRIPAVLGSNDKNILPIKLLSKFIRLPLVDSNKLPKLNFVGVKKLSELVSNLAINNRLPYGKIFYIANEASVTWNDLVNHITKKGKKTNKTLSISTLQKFYQFLSIMDFFSTKRKLFPLERFYDIFYRQWDIDNNKNVVVHFISNSLEELFHEKSQI